MKLAVRDASDDLVRLLPRTGLVQAPLPNGRTLRLWSRADDLTASPVFWRGWDGYETTTVHEFWPRAQQARVILDIGAHVGYFTLLGALANPTTQVFAFEPNPTVHERLRRNIALNGLTNVTAVAKAVGRAPAQAEFYFVPTEVPTNSSLSLDYIRVCPEIESTRVDVVTIDDFVREHALVGVDLVKIDTETTEPDVLRGMAGVLKRDHPAVICEILTPRADREIREIMEPLGYVRTLIAADSRNHLFVFGGS